MASNHWSIKSIQLNVGIALIHLNPVKITRSEEIRTDKFYSVIESSLKHIMSNTLFYIFLIAATLCCPNEDFCRQCDFETSVCLKCENSVLNKSSKKCDVNVKPIANCDTPNEDDASLCKKCVYGFGVTTDLKSCVKCEDANCASCPLNPKKCEACFGKFVLNEDNVCVVDDRNLNPNCAVNHSNSNARQPGCLQCSDNFSLAGINCVAQTISKCAIIDIFYKGCQVCVAGYYIHEDKDCVLNGQRKPDKNKGSKWLIFFLIVLIIGAGAAAYWYFKIRPQNGSSESLIV